MGHGLQMICKTYGGIRVKGADGTTKEFVWDYKLDRPVDVEEARKEQKRRSEERRALIERAKKAVKQQELF